MWVMAPHHPKKMGEASHNPLLWEIYFSVMYINQITSSQVCM